MRPLRLAATDFMGYAELDLDLSSVSLLAVVGKNGRGKSSLFYALTWCLYGRAPGSTADVLIRDGADAARVALTFSSGEDVVTVERTRVRGQSASLALIVNDEPKTRHTVKETQAVIESLIGLPYEAMIAGPLVIQGRSDAFMAALPSKRKALLVSLFDLDKYEVLHEKAKARRDAAAGEVASLDRRLDEIDATLAGEAAVIEELAPLLTRRAVLADCLSLSQERVTLARERVAGLRAQTTAVVRLQGESGRLENQITMTSMRVGEQRKKLVALREVAAGPAHVVTDADHAAADAAVEDARRTRETAVKGLATAKARVAAYAEIKPVTCPECRTTFVPGVAPDERAAAEANVVHWEKVLLIAGERLEARKADLAEAHRGWEATRAKAVAAAAITAAEDAIRGMTGEIEAATVALEAAKADLAAAAAAARAMGEATEELDGAQTTLTSVAAELSEVEPKVAALEAQLKVMAAWRNARPGMEAERAGAEATRTTYAALAKAFHRDGIPTMILEGGLPLIEERANDALAKMPGGLSITMTTTRMTQKGTEEDTLDILVTKNGREREYALLSGGERFRIDLALRLGLTAARASRAVESLIIDEGFGSQDDEGKEGLIESISAIADDFAFVAVISHVKEVVERFPARLEVDMTDDVSSAQLVA